MTLHLTEKEAQILAFIKESVAQKGYPPSVREIGQSVNLKSSSTVHNYLIRLEQKGQLRRDPNKTRAMEIISQDPEKTNHELLEVPLLGQVAAGVPLLAQENQEFSFPLPSSFTGKGDFFMLTIKGDSMIEAGIIDGDWVVVRQQQAANNGEIVVALLGEEATVKRYYREKDQIRLQPENSMMQPIFTHDVQILGKVTGLLRKI